MAFRKAKKSDFFGKTIVSINANACNVLRLDFSDGSEVELWAEDAVHTVAGSIPGIFVDDVSLDKKKARKKKTKHCV